MSREKIKDRIVSIVRRAGEIDGHDLFAMIYQNHQDAPDRTVLKQHIFQLRKLGYPIRGTSRTPPVYVWGSK